MDITKKRKQLLDINLSNKEKDVVNMLKAVTLAATGTMDLQIAGKSSLQTAITLFIGRKVENGPLFLAAFVFSTRLPKKAELTTIALETIEDAAPYLNHREFEQVLKTGTIRDHDELLDVFIDPVYEFEWDGYYPIALEDTL